MRPTGFLISEPKYARKLRRMPPARENARGREALIGGVLLSSPIE
jgi:hypothetical protein